MKTSDHETLYYEIQQKKKVKSAKYVNRKLKYLCNIKRTKKISYIQNTLQD